jgi:hypothetical protein
MLQLNVLPSCTSLASLKRDFSVFGRVVATTLSPSWLGELIGFVLFERYVDAERARESCTNAILFPESDPSDFIKGFTESDRVTGNCVAVYDLPAATTRNGFQADCQQTPALQASAVVSDGQTKTGFAYYGSQRSVAAAYSRFVASGLRASVLHGNGLVSALRALNKGKLPWQWERCILFLKYLPAVSNRRLYEEFRAWGDVVAVFQTINPQLGEPAGSGVAIFDNPAVAQLVLNLSEERRLKIAGSSVMATVFRNANFTQRPAAKPEPKIPPLPGAMSAREFLRQFITSNVPEGPLRDRCLAYIAGISINDTYRLRDALFVTGEFTPQTLLDTLIQSAGS